MRWDSLGEFLALAVSLEHLGSSHQNTKALVLAQTLENATDKFLENNKSPSRKVGKLDNRGSHFYLAMYWAEGLANQDKDAILKATFSKVSKDLNDNETKIVAELADIQGSAHNIGGYYLPNEGMADDAMKPNITFNSILQDI